MSQISELEQRITAALERIGAGVTLLGARPDGEIAKREAAEAALEDEKLANAQLEERLRLVAERQEDALKAAEEKRNEERAAAEDKRNEERASDLASIAKLDEELQKLRAVNEQLRENNSALRTANEEGVGDPHLINTGLRTEVDALRAAQAADRAEVATIMNVLEPMLEATKEERA